MSLFISIFALMLKKGWRKILKWLRIAAIVYIICGIILYFLQEWLLFRPTKLPADHVFTFPLPFKELNVTFNENKNLNIVQFTVPDSVCRGIVLYFHGNRQNIERYAPYAVNFTKNNYKVWMIDYPGYGKSTGERTEKILYDDALELCKMARAHYPADSIIFYGKSLGTGIAAQLASVRNCKRLILESPYYSIGDLFTHYAFMYPRDLFNKYELPTYQRLPGVVAPVTIFHGTNDHIIPFSHSKSLLKLAKPGAELISIKGGGHNDLNDFPLYHQKLDSLLSL